MFLAFLPNRNQMPYLHYEKRCNQAKIHEIIKHVKPGAPKLRQRDNHNEKTGSPSSQSDIDGDHTSPYATSCEPLNLSSSPASAANRVSVPQTQQMPSKDEGQSNFLDAEIALIEGYLYGQEKLHVSIRVRALFFDFKLQRSR